MLERKPGRNLQPRLTPHEKWADRHRNCAFCSYFNWQDLELGVVLRSWPIRELASFLPRKSEKLINYLLLSLAVCEDLKATVVQQKVKKHLLKLHCRSVAPARSKLKMDY